jgi:hypothetical protein
VTPLNPASYNVERAHTAASSVQGEAEVEADPVARRVSRTRALPRAVRVAAGAATSAWGRGIRSSRE